MNDAPTIPAPALTAPPCRACDGAGILDGEMFVSMCLDCAGTGIARCLECGDNGCETPAELLADGAPSCAACAGHEGERWVHCTGTASACVCWCCRRDRDNAAREAAEATAGLSVALQAAERDLVVLEQAARWRELLVRLGASRRVTSARAS